MGLRERLRKAWSALRGEEEPPGRQPAGAASAWGAGAWRTVRLPGGLVVGGRHHARVTVRSMTFGDALLAEHAAEGLDGFPQEQALGLARLASRVTVAGRRMTPQELMSLSEADAAVVMRTAREVAQEAAPFRGGRDAAGAGDDADRDLDGLESEGDPGDA